MAAALDRAHMKEGIPRSIGQLYEPEALFRVVPFNHGSDRGTGGRFKPLGGKPRCRFEIAPRWFKVIVIETTTTGGAKISGSAAHWILLGV